MKAHTISHLLLMMILMVFMAIETGNARAETRYVSDVLVIDLRIEPEKDSEKIRTLQSNTPLEVIQESGEYLKVRTGKNEEGWVVKRYTTSALPKSMVIAELSERINQLEKIRKDLEEELNEIKKYQDGSDEYKASIRKEREDAAKAILELEAMTQQYNALYEKSRDVIAMSEKIKILEGKIIKLNSSNDKLNKLSEKLKQEKKDRMRAGIIRWFLAGSGVLFAGIMLGKLSRKKDYY